MGLSVMHSDVIIEEMERSIRACESAKLEKQPLYQGACILFWEGPCPLYALSDAVSFSGHGGLVRVCDDVNIIDSRETTTTACMTGVQSGKVIPRIETRHT
jgi:hypothetical protein